MDKNKIINQKFFYCDDNIKVYKFRTIENIKITEKKKNELIKYLKEKKISIKYFENFDGYINLIKFESYKEGFDYLVKGIYIQFINSLYKNKKINIFFIESQKDIEIILLILKYYLKDFSMFISKKEYLKIMVFGKLKLYKNLIFYVYVYNKNLKNLIRYFEKYLSLLIYIDNVFLIEKFNVNNYIYVKKKQDLNLKKIDKLFFSNIKNNIISIYEKECLLQFEGLIYLVEIEVIINNQKIKRFILFLYDLNIETYFMFSLLDKNRIDFTLDIIRMLWTDNNVFLDKSNFNLNILEDNIYDYSFYEGLIYNDIFEGRLDVSISQNIQIIKVHSLQNLMFYLIYYSLFF